MSSLFLRKKKRSNLFKKLLLKSEVIKALLCKFRRGANVLILTRHVANSFTNCAQKRTLRRSSQEFQITSRLSKRLQRYYSHWSFLFTNYSTELTKKWRSKAKLEARSAKKYIIWNILTRSFASRFMVRFAQPRFKKESKTWKHWSICSSKL